MRLKPLSDIYSASESAEPAYRAEGIDEYRELAMLAGVWERDSLESEAVEGPAAGSIDDGKGQKPASP